MGGCTDPGYKTGIASRMRLVVTPVRLETNRESIRGMMNEGAQPEPFVDADAVAAFLSIKRRQVLELARSGRIPAHPLLGSRRKVWRFRLSEVDAAVVSGIRQRPIPSSDEAL